jgi:hypothetical protein
VGVSVDLAVPGRQLTGSSFDSYTGVENVTGSPYDDVLRGDAGRNTLGGGFGNDFLDGRDDADGLVGGPGDDEIEVPDGGPDRVLCGPDFDLVLADIPGIDTLTDCEDVLFPTSPPAPTPNVQVDGPKPTTTTTTVTAAADKLAPSFLGKVGATPARFRVAARAGFRYSLSEAATVTFAIERRTTGRRVKRVGTFRAQAKTGANRTPLARGLARTKLAPGTYRARLTATDAAGNKSRTATVTFTVLTPTTRRGAALR